MSGLFIHVYQFRIQEKYADAGIACAGRAQPDADIAESGLPNRDSTPFWWLLLSGLN